MPRKNPNIPVKVQNLSGFDKSFRNSGTLTCGTITPLLCDEVIPNTRVSLRANLAAQLPPLVSDTYMNTKLKVEAFFTPLRLLCRSFENFFCDFPKEVLTQESVDYGYPLSLDQVAARIPVLSDSFADSMINIGPGSLLDYLGYRTTGYVEGYATSFSINPLPLVNYHLVWQEYYRNPRVQKPAFAEPIVGAFASFNEANTDIQCSFLPYIYFHDEFVNSEGATIPSNVQLSFGTTDELKLVDGVRLDELRQRNFGLDYFTGARVSPQQGFAAAVAFHVDLASEIGSFTIAQLRAQNSLQQFRERNNLASPRLVDQVKARYGANLSDGVAQRPICIGSATYDIASRGVDQTAVTAETGSNPFNSVASQYGRAYGVGSDFIIKDFTANEPGYILVNVTLVPEVTYSNGLSPLFMRYRSKGSITDMACSILQNVGDQPIRASELLGAEDAASNDIFGFTDRYGDFMYMPNQAHGEMRENGTLHSFVLQRSFESVPELSSEFLEIPKDFMDDIFAVSEQVSNVSAWYDAVLDYKVVMPLAEFSLPSLQDPAYEHGHTVVLRRNGQIF